MTGFGSSPPDQVEITFFERGISMTGVATGPEVENLQGRCRPYGNDDSGL